MKHIKLFESWLNHGSIVESTVSSTFVQEVKDALEKENFTLKFVWGKDSNDFAIFNKDLFLDSLEDFKKLNGSHCKIIHEIGNNHDYLLGNNGLTVRTGSVKLDEYSAKFEPGNVDEAVSKIKDLYLKEAYIFLLGEGDVTLIPNDLSVPSFMKKYTLPDALAKFIFDFIELDAKKWDFWSRNVPSMCEIASPLLLAMMKIKFDSDSKSSIKWGSLSTSFELTLQGSSNWWQTARIEVQIKPLKDSKHAYGDLKKGKKIQFSPEIEFTCTAASAMSVPVVIKNERELLKMIGSEDQEFSDALKWAMSMSTQEMNDYMEKYKGRIHGLTYGI